MKAKKIKEEVKPITVIPSLNEDLSIIDEAVIIFEYNDFKGEFDMSDLENQKLYRESANIITDSIKTINEQMLDKNISDIDKSEIATKGKYEGYVNFFDAVFHEGAGKQIIGEKINSRKAIIAFAAFTRFLQNQQIAKSYELSDVLHELHIDEYKYNPNRAERRKNKS